MSVIVVEQTRGPLVENLFRGEAAVVDGTGRLLYYVGDPTKTTFWRSSAKPIQAMPLLLSGAADAFGFGPEHLAMFCASHNGEPVHTETVLEALRLAGLSPDLLQCGAHAPYDRATAEQVTVPQAIHNNCSGKHTGMLSLAKHLGLPLDSYLDPGSKLQQLILENVADVVGLPADQIAIGVDGCGVPVFGLPLHNMAYAFARLADPAHMPAGKAEAGRRFRDAMRLHPHLVAGRKRLCTDIMELGSQHFVAKSGAEGVYCVGVLPEAVATSPRLAGAQGGIGIAVKAEDGHKEIRHLMVYAILDQLGLLSESDRQALSHYQSIPIKNHAGRLVGQMRSVFEVTHA
jgi:L-asparaginase II